MVFVTFIYSNIKKFC